MNNGFKQCLKKLIVLLQNGDLIKNMFCGLNYLWSEGVNTVGDCLRT